MRVGWIVDTFPYRPSRTSVWVRSGAMLTMRYRNMVLWLNRMGFQNSFYQRGKAYDVVVIIKTFTEPVLAEVQYLKAQGIPLIFDANVNYYYIWGDYPDPKTIPTPELQRAAIQITRQADHVIADSVYLREVVRDFNPKVTWIPDNVLPWLFRPAQHRAQAGFLRLIWAGVSFKSDELALLKPVFADVAGLELWLVSETRPTVIDQLQAVIPIRWFPYSDFYYAWLLGRADVIISPRSLNNGYNLGHTEYKISLGMARNLPALASPQPAYRTALQAGGGIICYTLEDWRGALQTLREDIETRWRMGQIARQTIEQHYLTPVVAKQVGEVIKQVLAQKEP